MPFRGSTFINLTGIFLFFCLISGLMTVTAHGADYAFQEVFQTYDYVSASTGGTLLELGNDEVSSPIDLGFTFDYYNNSTYTQVIIGDNGAIGFPGDTVGLDTAVPPLLIPDGADPNAVIAPLSSDLDPSKGGSIFTLAGGVAGERFFVVEWVGVPVQGQGGVRTFEVILYEDNSDILFQYRTLSGGEVINAANTTIGIENQDGTTGLTLPDPSGIEEGQSILFTVNNPDSDGDGMIDRFENFYVLDTAVNDAGDDKDSDGVTNLQEFNAGTKVNQADSEGDEINDGPEFGADKDNPRDSDRNGSLDAVEADSDKDGLRDIKEDVNEDGVPDPDETDQASPDTDDDGYGDAMEITFVADPIDNLVSPSLSGYTLVSGLIQDAIDNAVPGDILYIPSKLDVDGRTIPHTENLTITKAITLIGADPDTALLEGGITISGVDNVVLTGFTIQNYDPAVQILGDAASATGVYLVNMTLKDCANGILISDDPLQGGAAGAATRATLEKVSFVITQDMGVGYGVRVEELQDGGDEAQINNTTLFQTGDVGAVVIQGSQNVTVTGCSLSSANAAGILVRNGNAVSSNVTINNNAIQTNFGHGIQVEDSSAVTIDRNTLSSNGGNGIDVADAAAVTVTDNFIVLNNEYGISSSSTVTVMNSGNFVSDNKIDSYNGNVDQQNETPAAEVGATSIGLITWESAAWIENAMGGTVAVIDSPNVLVDPLSSLFGASITVQPGSMTSDTVVTVAQSQEALPALPIAFDIAMPVVQISLNSASLINNSTATVTLPVLAGFDPGTARVFRLVNNNSWEEITPLTRLRHLDTEPSLHQRVSFESDISQTETFELVIALPLINNVDESSSGCGIQRHIHTSGDEINLPDMFLVYLPALILFLKRLKQRAVG